MNDFGVITLSVFTPMKLSYAWYYSMSYKGGGLIEREGLITVYSPERGAYWRGGLN